MDDEIRVYFDELRRELNARFDAVDARFDDVDARFNGVDGRFAGIDARFDAVESRITAEVAAARNELGVLIEHVRHELAVVAETTLDNSRRLTANEAATDRLRETVGLHMAELRVAIVDLRARR